MITVKNENISALRAEELEPTNSSKPLELLRLRDSSKNDNAPTATQDPAAAAGMDRLGRQDPARTSSGYDPERIVLAIGVIATAVMLTYGNGIMEILFTLLGL